MITHLWDETLQSGTSLLVKNVSLTGHLESKYSATLNRVVYMHFCGDETYYKYKEYESNGLVHDTTNFYSINVVWSYPSHAQHFQPMIKEVWKPLSL